MLDSPGDEAAAEPKHTPRLALGVHRHSGAVARGLEPVADAERDRPLDYLEGEEPLRLELGHLDDRRRLAPQEAPLLRDPRPHLHRSVGPGRPAAPLPCGEVRRVGQEGEDLGRRTVDHDRVLDPDHGGQAYTRVVSGTIVVGVDESPAARSAVRWAGEEARLRAATIKAVHAWVAPLSVSVPEPAVGGYPLVPELPAEELRVAFEARGRALIEEAFAEIDGVDVEPVVVDGDAGEALVSLSTDADLLVVGARHRGGVTGLVLGSVSQYCVHHASCPVVVVPPA